MRLRASVLRLLPFLAVLAVLAFPASASADNPPTLTILTPSAGTILTGTATVTVDAQDDIGVDHVIYRLNPGNGTFVDLGTSSTPPFTFQFDTTTFSNCAANACTLYAQAVDTGGNISGGPQGVGVSVGINNDIVVDTTADNTSNTGSGCSLRQAMASATDNVAYAGCTAGVSNRPDTIDVPAGTYALTAGQLDVQTAMNIVGAGAHATDIQGYSLGQRVLEISSGNTTLEGLTIEGGSTSSTGPEDNHGLGGGIYVRSSAGLGIHNVIVKLNHADTSGGGIYSNGVLTVANSSIESNNATFGGGITAFGTSFAMTNSTVNSNTANNGAGGGLYLASPAGFDNATIADNVSNGTVGGGIAVDDGLDPLTVHLSNTLLARNRLSEVPSNCSTGIASLGFNLADDATCVLNQSGDKEVADAGLSFSVDTNGSTDVLPLTNGSPAIDAAEDESCTPLDQIGTARQGAHCDIGAAEFVPPPSDYFVSTEQELVDALSSASANGVPATIHIAAGDYLLDNVGSLSVQPQDGGPITLAGAGAGSTTIDGDNEVSDVIDVGGSETTTIRGLTITRGGSGDGINNNGNLVLEDSVVQNNGRLGIESTNAGLVVSGSTITDNGSVNSSSPNNGGIFTEAPFEVVNTTITGNRGHGFYVDSGGAGSLNNVTIAGNNGDGLSLSDTVDVSNTIVANNDGGGCTSPQGFVNSLGHNLDSDSSCFFNDQTDLHTDPLLGPLQDNGGPTPTMALAFGSPALEAGDNATCESVDQRGVARPQGAHCDIGASELFVATVNTTADAPDGASCATAADVCSLREAVSEVNGLGGGAIEFDIPTGGAAPTITLNSPVDAITVPVLIDGRTQPGTPARTPGVTIVPGLGFFSGSLLELAPGSDGSNVHGLAFGGNIGDTGTTAISVESNTDFITGNAIGVAPDGSALGLGDVGIEVVGNSNTIGGGTPSLANVIIGSRQQAISVDSPNGDTPTFGNVIQGNLIGLEPNGAPAAAARGNGISVSQSTGTVVGNDAGPGGLFDQVQPHPELGNVISGMGDAIRILNGSSGTIAAGNFIGVDRNGDPTGLNADGVVVNAASSNQIGPGNRIAHATHDGVWIPSGVGDRIVANSIFDSGNLGIELASGANHNIAAPVITSVSNGVVTGNFPGFNSSVFIEIFINGSCTGQFASGAGQTFANFTSAGPGETWSASVPGLEPGEGVTATATDALSSDTSEFSNCAAEVPRAESIAFESNRNGSSEIFLMNPDGSNPVQLTHDPQGVTDTLPSISPDGKTIAYQSNAGGSNQIWEINSDGSNPRQLTSSDANQGTNQQPTFSPDGTRIAFDSNRNGNFQLFVMNADGTGQTQVTHTNGSVGGSGWSPDGSQIAFNDDATEENEIYTVNVGTGAVTAPLTSAGQNRNPHWSPDGSEILFVSSRCDPFTQASPEPPICQGGESVFLMNADGTNQQNLTQAPIFDADPAWSPDGSHIAFVRDLGGQNFNVFKANPDGTNQVQLTQSQSRQRNSFPNWGSLEVGATGASASLSSDPSVQMPGTVPIGGIPLSAFDPQPAGAPPISTHGTQLNQTQLNQTQLNQTQLNQTQLNQTQLNQTQLNQTQLNQTQLNQTQLNQTSPLASQLNQTQLNQTQLNQTQLNQTQLNQTQLNQTQLNQSQLNQTQLNQTPLDPTQFPDGWAGLLRYTNLANAPLQTITLGQVMSLTPSDVTVPPSAPPGTTPNSVINTIQHLTFANLEIQSTSLAQLSLGALLLGDFDINQLGSGLTSPIESQLNSWCLSFAPAGDPHNFCSGHAIPTPGPDLGGPGIGYFNLIQLTLMGAPVQSLQLNQTQLNQTQLNQTQLNQTQLNQTPVGHLASSASGIVGMQLSRLDFTSAPGLGMANRQVNLLGAGVPDTLFDCSSFNCSTGTLADAQRANAIRPSTTVGDLDHGNFFIGVAAAPGVTAVPPVTISQLLDNVLGPNSAYKDIADFGDLVGLYLRASDVKWETLPPNLLAIFDPDRPQMSMNAGFTIQGSGTVPADVTIALPAGFDYVPGSSVLLLNGGPSFTPPGEPTITGTSASGYTLEWHLAAVTAGSPYSLGFDAFGGTTVGPAQAKETISSGGFSDSSIAAFSVTDSFPGNDTTGGAPSVDPTAGQGSVEMSTLAAPGAVDYYTIPMPAAGTRIQVHLTNLPADYDLALYSPRTTSVRTGTAAAPPLQDGIVPDTQVDLNGGSNGQLTPLNLQDIPDPGIRLVQASSNRHTDPEDVGMVSPGGGGVVTIAVFGYNGAFSPKAYTLRVKQTAPTTPSCPARVFPHSGAGTTPDSLPALTSLPANLNTIILVDEKRLGDTYGATGTTGESTALAALRHLAGDATLGVSGVVVPVETIPGVQGLYNTWDTNPCDPNAANAVANAIANEVNAIKAARPSVSYLVFGGGDDQIPFFRLPDLSLIANESGFATQFGPNQYQGSLAAGDLLSDDPYLDTNPVPASGQQLFPPNLAGGRLVETAQEITNAVNAFEHAPTPGTLRSSTGFVSGYDFVADGAQQVATNLRAKGVNVTTLGGPTSLFSLTQFLGAAFPTGGSPANINSWNGHYDNYRAQMANGDILSTSGVPAGLNNGVFFTMGCHAGFQTTDAVVGSTVLDWPQYFAQHNTGFVGNTGYGLGDTDTVAFSEELMADLAGSIGGSTTLGQSLLQAKRQYYLSRVAFSNYDEKALSEAELYGLPMYGVGTAPRSLAAPASPSPDPVHGATSSTSPSQGSLSPFTTGVQSANFSAAPHFLGPITGQDGRYFTNDGQVQAPNYRPLQPFVSLPAARSGLVAHGVVIDGLTSSDTTGFTPDNVRPTLNSSATEPSPSFTDEAWPEKIPTLVSLGSDQSLNLITGQFFTPAESSSSTTGVERLWTQIGGRVTYSNSPDFTPPTIDSIDSFLSNGVVAFTGRFSDLAPGTVAFAQVVYDDGLGHWTALPLQFNSGSGAWSGGAPFSGTHVQFFVEVCDDAGNCGYSSNKGRYFDAEPLPSGSGSGGTAGTLTLTPQGQTSGQWYVGTGGVTVAADTTAPAPSTISASVDGGPFDTVTGPITLHGDGAHIVVARDSAGNTATGAYLVDTTAPAITPAVSPAAPTGTNGWYKTAPTLSFSCTDNLSGVASCSGPTTLGQSASVQSVPGSAADNAGNTSHVTAPGLKVDLSDPAAPVFHNIAAQTYPFGNVPAFGNINCTSSDGISGLHDCTVDPSGYSTQPGPHTLTATATDNAGRKTTASLTYTVGFTQACLSTTLSGSLTIKSGTAYCIQTGGKVTGSVTVLSGGSLYVNGGTLSGALTSTGATALTLCGASVGGSVGISSSSGLVQLGAPSGSGCSANKFSGSLTLNGNNAGVTAVGNTIGGTVSASNNKGGVLFSGNKDSAAVTISGNTGGVTFTNNVVNSSVTISNTTGGFTFSGNTISGKLTLTNNH
jgi:CSLREA domain-containing protein